MYRLIDILSEKTGMSREEIIQLASAISPNDTLKIPTHMYPGGHACPIWWPSNTMTMFEKMCLFVQKNRKVPMVLWELMVRIMRCCDTPIDKPEWLCTYRIDHTLQSIQKYTPWCMKNNYPFIGSDHMKSKFGEKFAWSIPTPAIIETK